MPLTVPWRLCGGCCALTLGFGAAAGCCASSATAATGVAARNAANLRRFTEFFTAYLASFGSGNAYSMPRCGRSQPTSTVGRPRTMAPPCAVKSPMRACGILIVSTVNDPSTMTSGGPTQTAMSPTRAAGKPPISTVMAPGGRIGPPTCGTRTVTMGQTCMSLILDAGIPIKSLLYFLGSQSLTRLVTSTPCATKLRNFSGAFSGSGATAAKITAPDTALAARNSPGGTTGASGGARLPVLKKAARPAQPAAVPSSAFWAAAMADRRLSSLGWAIHFSVASSAALIFGGGFSPAARRAHTQPHHTASRLGSAWAINLTASGYRAFSMRSATKSSGCRSPRTSAIASSPSSATVASATVFELIGAGVLAISVDRHDAALHLRHRGAVHLRHHSLDFGLDLRFDLDHHAVNGHAHLVDLDQLIVTMPPCTCVIAEPFTCVITALTSAWICASTLIIMPLMVTPIWSILMLLCPTLSSMDCIASVSILPISSLIVWLPILIWVDWLPIWSSIV